MYASYSEGKYSVGTNLRFYHQKADNTPLSGKRNVLQNEPPPDIKGVRSLKLVNEILLFRKVCTQLVLCAWRPLEMTAALVRLLNGFDFSCIQVNGEPFFMSKLNSFLAQKSVYNKHEYNDTPFQILIKNQ